MAIVQRSRSLRPDLPAPPPWARRQGRAALVAGAVMVLGACGTSDDSESGTASNAGAPPVGAAVAGGGSGGAAADPNGPASAEAGRAGAGVGAALAPGGRCAVDFNRCEAPDDLGTLAGDAGEPTGPLTLEASRPGWYRIEVAETDVYEECDWGPVACEIGFDKEEAEAGEQLSVAIELTSAGASNYDFEVFRYPTELADPEQAVGEVCEATALIGSSEPAGAIDEARLEWGDERTVDGGRLENQVDDSRVLWVRVRSTEGCSDDGRYTLTLQGSVPMP